MGFGRKKEPEIPEPQQQPVKEPKQDEVRIVCLTTSEMFNVINSKLDAILAKIDEATQD